MQVFKRHLDFGNLATHVIGTYFNGPCDELDEFVDDEKAVWQVCCYFVAVVDIDANDWQP